MNKIKLKHLVAKEIIILSVGLIITIIMYFSIQIYNSIKKKDIDLLKQQQTQSIYSIENLNNLSNYVVQDGAFKSKEEFFQYITDTAFQRDFFSAEKNGYLKNCSNLKEFQHKYFLDSIKSLKQFELAEEKLKTKKSLINNEIDKTSSKIISNDQIKFFILILIIILYPLRLSISSIIWAIKTIRQSA